MDEFSRLEVGEVDGQEAGRQLWKLHASLTFTLRVAEHAGLTVKVPKGYVTDFASVPRPFWPIFPPQGQWCKAAVVHDYLCGLPGCSRFLADAIFREAMFRLGVPWWRRVVMYYAVRFYGALFVRKR